MSIRYLKPFLSSLVVLMLVGAGFTGSLRAEEDFFPFSVWYSGGKARAPMLEKVDATSRQRWGRDLRQIRELGFNTVRTWVEWTACEPKKGQYDFSNLQLLLELAQEVGLKVLVQVYVDSAPEWVGEDFGDGRFVAQNGTPIPSQSAPGFCFDHPGVQESLLKFYTRAAEVATRFPNFLGWDLWSEPHIINWAIIDYIPNATFCYCSHSVNRFQGWLQARYGSLEQLNLSWYRTFTKWTQVEPPRFGTILSYTDFIDWRTFVQEKLAEDLGMRAEAVRKVDPDKVVTSHAAVPCLYTSPLWGVGAPDDWRMAEKVDFWGTSIYPKHSFPDRHWDLLQRSVLMDFARGSGHRNNGFYVGELQAGMGIRGTVVGDPVTAEDHREWVWGLLARGARAINVYAYYPMNSGYEAGGYGLINLDGSSTPRSRKTGQLARVVAENASLFLKAEPAKAEVAVVYNPLGYLVGGHQRSGDASAVRDSVIGIYQAFWRTQIPIDFVHLKDIEQGIGSTYRLLFLPYPLMLTREAALQLKDFVESGGTLVAEARCGWNDDRGYSQDVIPGFGLHEVFRVREGKLRMGEQIQLELTKPVWGLEEGERLVGYGIQEELLPEDGSEVLAAFADGSAALTRNTFGKGQALAVGSFLGWQNRLAHSPANEKFFRGIAEELGVRPVLGLESLPEDGTIEIRVAEAGTERLLFLFNHGSEAFRLELPLEAGRNLETGVVENLTTIELRAKEVRVYWISG